MRVYSYSRCSTCRKALNWLKDKNITYNLIDITERPPSKEKISDAIKELGDRKYILNTSGKSYRAIGAESIKAMSEKELIALLSKDGKLIKRPFVISNDLRIIVGFNEAKWEDFFFS